MERHSFRIVLGDSPETMRKDNLKKDKRLILLTLAALENQKFFTPPPLKSFFEFPSLRRKKASGIIVPATVLCLTLSIWF